MNLSGELTQDEIIEAVQRYVTAQYGLTPEKIEIRLPNDEVSLSAVFQLRAPAASAGIEKPSKHQPKNFKRKNLGFFTLLASYIHAKTKQNRAGLPYEEVYIEMKKAFGNDLTNRKFSIYARDKRQQEKHKWEFDTKRRVFKTSIAEFDSSQI